MYLSKQQIEERLDNEDLVIRPLLDRDKQVGEVSIDLRLGTDFLVSYLSRSPYIDATGNSKCAPITSFFSPTRRRFGEDFLLHPHQTILCSSLEYIKMPSDVFAILNLRSSYNRLGLSLSTIVQPSYMGCFSIELTNENTNPIKLRVGARIFQTRFAKSDSDHPYFQDGEVRKYVCQVRPLLSKAGQDKELIKIHKYYESLDNQF